MGKFNKPTKEAEEIGLKISSFYLEKNDCDYEKAGRGVEILKIINIEVNQHSITIYLNRPGRLIGRHGKNIEALFKFLNRKINIVESFHWDEILVPQDWREFWW